MTENPPSAKFEILLDGRPQSGGDHKEVAIASAELIKSQNPHSDVSVRNTETGEVTPVNFTHGAI